MLLIKNASYAACSLFVAQFVLVLTYGIIIQYPVISHHQSSSVIISHQSPTTVSLSLTRALPYLCLQQQQQQQQQQQTITRSDRHEIEVTAFSSFFVFTHYFANKHTAHHKKLTTLLQIDYIVIIKMTFIMNTNEATTQPYLSSNVISYHEQTLK